MGEIPKIDFERLLKNSKTPLNESSIGVKSNDTNSARERYDKERQEKIQSVIDSSLGKEKLEDIYRRFSIDESSRKIVVEALLKHYGNNHSSSIPSASMFTEAKTWFPSERAESLILAYEAITKEVLNEKGYAIKDLSETTLSQHKRIEVVVHPLWVFLQGEVTPENWKKAQGNIDVFTSSMMTEAAREAASNLEKSPGLFLETIEMDQELHMLSSLPPAEKFRVYVLPRRADLYPYQAEILDAWLKKYGSGESIGLMESATGNTGAFLKKDTTKLNEVLSKESSVEISGGYMRQCMLLCLHDLMSLEKAKNMQFSINFDAATSSHVFNYYLHGEEYADHIDDDPAFVIKPPVKPADELWTEEDVKAWIEQNDTYYQEYRRRTLPEFERALNQTTKKQVEVR